MEGAVNRPLTTLVNSLFSHNIKYTNSTFSSWILFSIASALFLEFSSQSNPYSKDLYLILRNTKFHNRFYISIYRLLLPSIDAAVLTRLFLPRHCKNRKNKLTVAKRYISLSLVNKVSFSAPHSKYPWGPPLI